MLLRPRFAPRPAIIISKGSRHKGWESAYGVTPKAGLSNFTPFRTA